MDPQTLAFPSPCGVLVLKSFTSHTARLADCFRPLAGFWFFNYTVCMRIRSLTSCFRPLAGFWFLNKAGISEKEGYELVSVPLRGSGS